MSQAETLAKIDAAAKTKKGSFAGVFIALLGLALLTVGPGLVIASFAPDVAERDKVGTGGFVTGAIGLGMVVLGWRMMFRRTKLSQHDLSGTLQMDYYVCSLQGGKVVTPPTLASVEISSTGLTVMSKEGAGQEQISVGWHEVTKARWYGLYYMMEVYRVSWADRELVFIPHDPTEALKYLGKFWLAFLLGGRFVSNIYAIKTGVQNMKLIRHLNPLHAYAKAYAPGKASYWSNYTPEKQVMEPVAIGAPLAVVACWLAVSAESATDDSSAGYPVLAVALLTGLLMLGVRALVELAFSKKISASVRRHHTAQHVQRHA